MQYDKVNLCEQAFMWLKAKRIRQICISCWPEIKMANIYVVDFQETPCAKSEKTTTDCLEPG